VNGLEIAEYADTFVPGLPVLLVSNEEMPFSLVRWPRSIVGLVPKEAPADEILAELRTHLR